MPNDKDILDEREAVASMDDIALQIVTRCSVISHWGGDEPFDGVLHGIAERIRKIVDERASAAN